MGLSWQHLLIVLVIALLVFGTKKLRSIGKDMGGAVKDFKDAMKDDDEPVQRRSLPRNEASDTDADFTERKSRNDQDR